MRRRLLLTTLCAVQLCFGNGAYADNIMPYCNTFVHVANDSGTRYDGDEVTWGAPDETYYMGLTQGAGKGLNSIHLTTDLSNPFGQVTVLNTTSRSTSGTLWITDTGGQGYSDDILLMVASSGAFSDNFKINIKSSGYSYNPGAPGTATYLTNAVNETFTKTDFIYGPQSYRFSTSPDYPFYSGQDTNDPSTATYFMLVDLYLGTIRDTGPVSVTYSLSGLDTQTISFNAYAWRGSSNQGSGIMWTNATTSSYAINSAPAPVPVPPAVFLFGSGLTGMIFMRRRKVPTAGA